MNGRDLVLVTGGASGIGAAAVEALAAAGFLADVIDLRPPSWPAGEALVWEIRLDIADETAVAQVIAGIEERHGPIYGLVNAAGILGKMHTPERIRHENWDREFAVDLRGTFLACREAGARMAIRGRGAIVNVASVAGMTWAPAHAYAPPRRASSACRLPPSGARAAFASTLSRRFFPYAGAGGQHGCRRAEP